MEYSSISRLLSQAYAASVSWHCFAAYTLGHEKRADANDIIVCFFTHHWILFVPSWYVPILEPPTLMIIWVLFTSIRISVEFVSVYLVHSIGLAFAGERVKSLGVPGFCFT